MDVGGAQGQNRLRGDPNASVNYPGMDVGGASCAKRIVRDLDKNEADGPTKKGQTACATYFLSITT